MMEINKFYESRGAVMEFDCDDDCKEELMDTDEYASVIDFPLYIVIDGVLYKKKDDFNRNKL